jgi:hypothetical protein
VNTLLLDRVVRFSYLMLCQSEPEDLIGRFGSATCAVIDVIEGLRRNADDIRDELSGERPVKNPFIRKKSGATKTVQGGYPLTLDLQLGEPMAVQKAWTLAMSDFMSMSRGRSQSLIISYFLEQIVGLSDICQQGSVILYNRPGGDHRPGPGSLRLYDKAINVNSIARFPGRDFATNEGLAGLVFRKRSPEYVPDALAHPEFIPVEGQDIGSIYCSPILLDDRQEPFGVVSFHNPQGSFRF